MSRNEPITPHLESIALYLDSDVHFQQRKKGHCMQKLGQKFAPLPFLLVKSFKIKLTHPTVSKSKKCEPWGTATTNADLWRTSVGNPEGKVNGAYRMPGVNIILSLTNGEPQCKLLASSRCTFIFCKMKKTLIPNLDQVLLRSNKNNSYLREPMVNTLK